MIDLTEAKLEMGEAGKGLIDEEYDEAVKQNNETASRMVAEGGAMDAGSDVDADGNMIQTVKYFDENGKEAPGLARHTAKYEEGRNAVDVAAEPSSRGKEVPVTTETPTMRGLRELQAEELETERKRFTPTESTKTEDGLNRQVYGSKVRYTDDKGNVVKWGELDADGNETAADAPGSTKLQADMDARTKRFNDGESVWSSMSDASKSFARAAQWNAAANAQRAERAYQSQQAMNGVIADADRIRNEKLAKKREQRLAAGDAFAIATSRLKGDVQKDPETGKIDDPRLRTEVDKDGVEHNYIVSVVGRDELGSVNSRRRNAGSMNEYNSVIARYEVDANGNKIGDVEFGVSDRVGGKAGSNNQFRFISSSQAARMLQKDLVANGVDAEDAKHQVVNTILGGLSNPYGWSTNQAGVLQTKQMQKNFDEGKNLTHNIAPEKGTTVDKQRELDIQQQNGVMNAITNLIKTEQAILGNAAASEADKTAARNRIAEYNATLKGLNGVFANINGGGVSSAANRPRTADDIIAEKTKQQKTAANSAPSAGNETAVNVGKDVKHESAKRASVDAKAPSDIVKEEKKPMSSVEIGKEEDRRLIEKEKSRESELKKRGGYVNKDGNYVINEENADFLRIAVQNGMIKAGSPEKVYANVEDAIKASDLAEEAKRKIYETFSAKVDQIENDARRLYPDKKSERDAYVKRMKDEWWNDFILPEHERKKNKPKSYDNQAVSRGNYVKIDNQLM